MARVLIIAATLAALPSLLGAAEPWKFADSSELKAAEKRYPDRYWYVHFQKAVEILDSPGGDLGEAITRLKLAIAVKTENEPGAMHPTTKETIEYFPYYHLARAFERREECPAAMRCLERGSQNVGKWKQSGNFFALKDSVEACATRTDLLMLADKILGWEGDKGGVILTAEGGGNIPQIRNLRERLGGKGADVKALSGQLKTGLLDLCSLELRFRSALLSRLREDWKPAFPSTAASEVDPASCPVPQGEGGIGEIRETVGALELCAQKTVRATRRAGAWGCEVLGALRRDTQGAFDVLRKWAEEVGERPPAADALPGPPPSCIEWSKAPPAKVAEAFEALAREKVEVTRTLEAKKKEIDNQVAIRQAGLRRSLETVWARLPNVPDECAANLQLGQAVTRQLRTLRNSLSPSRVPDSGMPPKDLLQADGLVQTLLGDLEIRMKGGVQQLRQNSDCEGIQHANLEKLPGALAGYLAARGANELETLCRTAKSADADIQTCWERNSGSVREDVRQVASLLQLAESASLESAGVLGPPGEGLGCLPKSLAELKNAQTKQQGSPVGEWVKQARSALTTAQACIVDFHKAAEGTYSQTTTAVRTAREMLQGASALPRTKSISEEFRATESKLEKVAPLYKATQAPSIAELKGVLEGAGLGGKVPTAAWELLGQVQSGDQQQKEARWLVVRDSAVLPELGRAHVTLGKWGPDIGRLGPLTALNSAFGAYARGDLDDAILALREAQRSRQIPPEGRQAALAHAAMSYFLYTKGLLVASRHGETELTRSLVRDAQQEARLAARADASFRLAGGLFPNRLFREAFEAYSHDGAR